MVDRALNEIGSLHGTKSWAGLDDTFATTIGDFLQLTFERIAEQEPPAESFQAHISLSEPEIQLELGIGVRVTKTSGHAMTEHLLGSVEDEESVRALVLEMANVLMGATKTAFAADGYAFTGGVPTSPTVAELRDSVDGEGPCRAMCFAAGSIAIECWVVGRERPNIQVAARDLVEGMVVVHDLHDKAGALIIEGGSRLTQTTAALISQEMGGGAMVSVSDPGKA